jgi:hypothetical protein
MIRRYALACTALIAIALGASGLAYKGAAKTQFAANCGFQAFIRTTPQEPNTKEALDLSNRVSVREVNVAVAGGLFARVAAAHKVKPGALAANTEYAPRIQLGAGTFVARLIDSDRRQVVPLTNAICDEFVASIKRQRAAEIDAQVKNIQARINAAQTELTKLAKIPPKKRTPIQQATLISQVATRKANIDALAFVLSLPLDSISVLTRASAAMRFDHRSLSHNLLIGIMAGLLASFLLILIGEAFAERKLGRAP